MAAYRHQNEMRAEHRRRGLCRCGKKREDKRFTTCAKCRQQRSLRWYHEKGKLKELHSPHCECGRGRKRSIQGLPAELHACVFCYEQDGTGPMQFEVLQTLRSAEGPMTTEAIAFEVGMTRNTAQIQLARLLKKGLIGKRTLEPYGGIIECGLGVQAEYYLRGTER